MMIKELLVENRTPSNNREHIDIAKEIVNKVSHTHNDDLINYFTKLGFDFYYLEHKDAMFINQLKQKYNINQLKELLKTIKGKPKLVKYLSDHTEGTEYTKYIPLKTNY